MPHSPHNFFLYEVAAWTCKKLLPSHNRLTPISVITLTPSSVRWISSNVPNLYGGITRVPFTLTRIFCPKFTRTLGIFRVTVLIHDDDFVLRASFVTRIENDWFTQSAVNWYLHEPWKLKNFPSKVLKLRNKNKKKNNDNEFVKLFFFLHCYKMHGAQIFECIRQFKLTVDPQKSYMFRHLQFFKDIKLR